MIVRTFLAVVAAVAIPIAVVGASEPAERTGGSTKKVCEIDTTIGTRLGNTRRCRTKAERDAHKAEARNTVDRMQAFKPTMCAPPRPSC